MGHDYFRFCSSHHWTWGGLLPSDHSRVYHFSQSWSLGVGVIATHFYSNRTHGETPSRRSYAVAVTIRYMHVIVPAYCGWGTLRHVGIGTMGGLRFRYFVDKGWKFLTLYCVVDGSSAWCTIRWGKYLKVTAGCATLYTGDRAFSGQQYYISRTCNKITCNRAELRQRERKAGFADAYRERYLWAQNWFTGVGIHAYAVLYCGEIIMSLL